MTTLRKATHLFIHLVLNDLSRMLTPFQALGQTLGRRNHQASCPCTIQGALHSVGRAPPGVVQCRNPASSFSRICYVLSLLSPFHTGKRTLTTVPRRLSQYLSSE